MTAPLSRADNGIVFELDTSPTTVDPLAAADYVERCMLSAIHCPVLRLSSASSAHDDFTFVVAKNDRFSDGSTVRVDDVLRTLVRSASSPLWARYIRYLERADVTSDGLRLRMRQPAAFFPDMLQAMDFAPTHPDGALGNGPYRLMREFDAGKNCYRLTPNPYFPGAASRPDVVFIVQTDVDGTPDRFLRGEVDVTNSTAFPLDRLADWRGHPALRRAPTGIYMQLEPNPAGGALTAPDVRRALQDCLDLNDIAAKFVGGIRPAPHGTVGRKSHRRSAIPEHLRISYHDFLPNRPVLEALKRQWAERLGIHTELVERDYADQSRADVDASFVLGYAAFAHPYAEFDQCAGPLRDAEFDRLLRRFAAEAPGSRQALERRIETAVPVIRLFEVIGHWLVSPRVDGFVWPSDSVFDFTRLRLVDRGQS
jgi:hypothetical protein